MDTLAYLHLALTYEEPVRTNETTPVSGRWFLAAKGRTFAKRGQYCLLALGTAVGLIYSAPYAFAIATKGDQNTQVTRVQKRLQELRFFSDEPTGYYGEVTVEAVKKFQRDRGITADGIVGKETEAALFGRGTQSDNPFNSDSFLSSNENPAANKGRSKSSRYLDGRKIRRPIVRPSARVLPEATAPQESFLSETLEPPTGTVKGNTDAKIQRPHPAPAAAATQDATELLKVGARGERVKEFQEKLQDAGYDPGEIDGVYGQQTKKAAIAFQRARGLEVDGIAGAQTLEALNSAHPEPSQRLYPRKIRNS
ncbi:peptidoglycan-binding protein [Oscillatoria sp. FACHB-1406]|uniref:peptidoglycan-binding domain-containing protein n=1 Tax=Oscillatoria sp. FACHB-1406 TaxID=2692846 RepID=UPI001685A43F|nr:peptidoglycan-binding protein [Oscillatoria sp. FACHB-1406]MBD2577237.1 peptidoglycan-binding protein [Oscillatoria sp. FACHB-1406]